MLLSQVNLDAIDPEGLPWRALRFYRLSCLGALRSGRFGAHPPITGYLISSSCSAHLSNVGRTRRGWSLVTFTDCNPVLTVITVIHASWRGSSVRRVTASASPAAPLRHRISIPTRQNTASMSSEGVQRKQEADFTPQCDEVRPSRSLTRPRSLRERLVRPRTTQD